MSSTNIAAKQLRIGAYVLVNKAPFRIHQLTNDGKTVSVKMAPPGSSTFTDTSYAVADSIQCVNVATTSCTYCYKDDDGSYVFCDPVTSEMKKVNPTVVGDLSKSLVQDDYYQLAVYNDQVIGVSRRG